MKRILIRTFSLAAMVGMMVVSMNTVRAEGTALEGAKQESGIEFGEMSGLKANGGSSAVSASGDGVSRSALSTRGKFEDMFKKAKGHPQVPSPSRVLTHIDPLLNNKRSQGGLLAEVFRGAGMVVGAAGTAGLILFGGAIGAITLLYLGYRNAVFSLRESVDTTTKGRVRSGYTGFMMGMFTTLPELGAGGGHAIGRGVERGASKIASIFK